MKRQSPTTHYFTFEEGTLPIRIRKHPRSRRIVIRYQPRTHTLALTLPRYVSLRQGLSFIEEKRSWVLKQLCEKPRPQAFYEGQEISVLGKNYRIQHVGGRGLVRFEGSVIQVPGALEFLPRRVKDFLKAFAKEKIMELAQLHAMRVEKKIAKITVRDTSSHWGSCNRKGNLSFSWRLILAPAEILEYVVCHEVAHLAHLNHSQKFWDVVEMLYPNHREARQWLKKHGDVLHTIH